MFRVRRNRNSAANPAASRMHRVDSTRASKDGHRYHEAWLARRSLELILSRGGLVAITAEGLHDEKDLSRDTIEIADATFYFGSINPESARAVRIEQFKYSVARAEKPFRASDAASTLAKFAASNADLVKKYGEKLVVSKFTFGLTTNRPIYSPFIEAVRAAATGSTPLNPTAREQHRYLLEASKLSGSDLRQFCRRLEIVGCGDTVLQIEGQNRRTIADWSASTDLHVRARIGELREIIRNRASNAENQNKTIVREDVLGALGIGSDADLLPTRNAFPPVGEVVEREQLSEFLDHVERNPLSLVCATGGVGKTVFVQSVAARLSKQHEVILFDCFGGGAYRVPTDGRHRAERGLMHIVNELAIRGLCDPILPGSQDSAEIVLAAIRRFDQCVAVLRRSRPGAKLVVILDAMDNAGREADDRGQLSFPRALFETFSHGGIPDGLRVVGTCRSERITRAIGNSTCPPYELHNFSLPEAQTFILSRRPDATPEQIAAIRHRSGSNPRIIANLVDPHQPLSALPGSGAASLNDLLQARIDTATKSAKDKGADEEAIGGFLCALSVLPPPVPIDELAAAFGQSTSAIHSFVSDLSPLLDQTRYGLIFRDEPTETLVRQRYGNLTPLLERVVDRLRSAQDTSPYAARSLPGLLFALGDVSGLERLAFDERFPPGLQSEVAKRSIRMDRLRTAVAAATRAQDANAMTALLVELSSVAIVHERGDDYFLNNPDLVVAVGDAEAARRLYESKRGWFGARPSRLAIAYTLEGEPGEAHDHAHQSEAWLRWLYTGSEEARYKIRPGIDDYAAWVTYLVSVGRSSDAANFLRWWLPWHGFRVARRVLQLESIARVLRPNAFATHAAVTLAKRSDCPPAYLAAVLEQHADLSAKERAILLRSLAAKTSRSERIDQDEDFYRASRAYRESVLSSAIQAYSYRLLATSKKLRAAINLRTYGAWSITDRVGLENLSSNLLAIALDAAFKNREPTLFDCLPDKLADLVKRKRCPPLYADQERAVERAIASEIERVRASALKSHSSDLADHEWTRLRPRLVPIVALSKALYSLITARTPQQKKGMIKKYFQVWEEIRDYQRKESYGSDRDLGYIDQHFLNAYLDVVIALQLRQKEAASLLRDRIKDLKFKPWHVLTAFVALFAKSSSTAEVAGEIATEIVVAIEQMDDTQERSASYAELARALVHADLAEAGELFAKGYQELNAFGSGDYSLATELVGFASRLERAPLSPRSAHTLGKIVELGTPYEPERFPWQLAAKAFCASNTLNYLAQIARWDDRQKIGLEYTIGPAVTRYVETSQLSPVQGLVLLSLVNPVETYAWQIEEFLEIALRAVPVVDHKLVASGYLDLLDRKYTRAVPARELTAFEAVFVKVGVAIPQPVKERLALMLSECAPVDSDSSDEGNRRKVSPGLLRKRKTAIARETAKVMAIAARIGGPSAKAYEELAHQIDAIDGRMDLKTVAFSELRSRLQYSQRQGYVEALVESQGLKLFEKLHLLKDAREEWQAGSPSKLSFFTRVGARLVELHAAEILTEEWGFDSILQRLVELSGVPSFAIAVKLANIAATKELVVDATTWLFLAKVVSDQAKPEVPRDALARILSSEAARLAEDIGDGKWSDSLSAPNDPDHSVAGLIWYSLGSPDTVIRWQAAHALREAAKLGLWRVLEQLFTLCAKDNAGPFQDPALPFFHMHARLWFLISVARIAIEHPEQVLRYRGVLEEIVRERSLPHPAMQDAAARALVCGWTTGKCPSDISELIARTNTSPFPPSTGKRPEVSAQRLQSSPNVDFVVDYDFHKHEVSRLSNLFDTADPTTVADMVSIIRRWDPTIRSMHDFAGKRRPSQSSYSHSANERLQSYGLYLGWHAIICLAGIYLQQKPVRKRHYDSNSWEEWLSYLQLTRKDGLWPSDGTDSYPRVATNRLCEGSGRDIHPKRSPIVLGNLIGLTSAGEGGSSITVEGGWKSPDSVSVRISSALVPCEYARRAGLAVAVAPAHFAWLPINQSYDEDDIRGTASSFAPIEPWLTFQETYERLDCHDPYMSRYAMERRRPAKAIVRQFDLVPDSKWFRSWSLPTGRPVLEARAWGGRRGHGQREEWDAGERLACDTRFLRRLLQTLNRELIILLVLEHYKDRDSFHDRIEDTDRFSHTTVVWLVDRSGMIRRVRPSSRHRLAIEKLSDYEKTDFSARFDRLASRSDRKIPTTAQ